MRRKGRKRNHYEASWGETIIGLGRLSDGRWVDLDDRAHPWTSDNEHDAIREFHRRRAKRDGETISMTTMRGDFFDVADLQEALEAHGEMTVNGSKGSVEVTAVLPSDAVWETVGTLIREKPSLAATRTGIKELGWLEDLEEPPPPLTLVEVGELFYGKRDGGGNLITDEPGDQGKGFTDSNEGKRSWAYWKEFCDAVAPAATVQELSEDDIARYHLATMGRGLTPHTMKNRYSKIGSVLNYVIDRRKRHRSYLQELKADFANHCKPPKDNEGNPDPIEPDDFAALYRAANVKWRAILLCMLNFGMHPKEVGDLLKDPKELNLHYRELRSNRTKTGVARVAMIWQETVDAIRAYQATEEGNEAYRRSPSLFLTRFSRPYAAGGLTQYFRETLRPRAEKSAGRSLACTLDSIRDGAQNAADDGGADAIHTEMLMGHKLQGVMGKYKQRTPKKTEQSVKCIYDHYSIGDLTRRCEGLGC